jgi:hypothetical protein
MKQGRNSGNEQVDPIAGFFCFGLDCSTILPQHRNTTLPQHQIAAAQSC